MTADDTWRSAPAAAPGGPPAVLAGNAGFLLGKVHELARDRFEQSLAPLGLKARHYGVLAALAEQSPVAQNALGDRLNIDRSTMVAVIDELEAAGRVVRRRNPQDRRAYQLELTEAGHAALKEAVRVVDRVQDEVFAPLDRGQRGQLQAMLTALLRHLTA
jgi:DNA-binding MarR family transcriptional regulator